MRSRALRIILAVVALAACAGAAVFIDVSEQHVAASRTAGRAFDAVVRDATNSVAEFSGDGVAKSIGVLRSMATTDAARAALDRASATAANFTEIAPVLDQLNTARESEQQAADATESAQRKLEAIVLAGAAALGLAVVAMLAVAGPASESANATAVPSVGVTPESTTAPEPGDGLRLRQQPEAAGGYVTSRPAGPVLRAASQLCTDLGRVSDAEELKALVAKAAELMDASGLIVWTAATADGQLVPALSHGYPAELLARLPPLARTAENAAAKAYRTGQLQIVLATPGSKNGAVVAPVLTSRGCVGVVSAEIRGGGETAESVQALAEIFAAQLGAVLHSTPAAHEQRATGT
ncbi:MAG TPA: hypothetical protein VG871_17580 [Vicinamibacterales bacterium]|nr:hypothetical protein [Vicinamibacterales bacterium]